MRRKGSIMSNNTTQIDRPQKVGREDGAFSTYVVVLPPSTHLMSKLLTLKRSSMLTAPAIVDIGHFQRMNILQLQLMDNYISKPTSIVEMMNPLMQACTLILHRMAY